MTLIDHPSPNFNDRPPGTVIDTVILHYTGMETGAEALARLCDPSAEVSSHYLIEEDGRTFRLVAEEKRAWHAGVSHWQGRDNLNHSSIGIELVSPGHEFGYRPFPEAQIAALLDLLDGIRARHGIPTARYLGHSDIAPGRKCDPGELFPWQMLASRGFGLWPGCDGSDATPVSKKRDILRDVKEHLGAVGYSVPIDALNDEMTKDAVRAFQAHWRPTLVTGALDEGTVNLLADLATQIRRTEET